MPDVGREGANMAAAVGISWSQILHQVSASLDDDAGPPAGCASLQPLPSGLDGAPFWTGALDRGRHHDDWVSPDRAELENLRRMVAALRDRIAFAESRADEVRTLADVEVRRVQAEADAHIEEIRGEAQAQVRLAELRAVAAEQWLTRIDSAARALLASDQRSAGPARLSAPGSFQPSSTASR